jgi:phenylacetate-CoA ligase
LVDKRPIQSVDRCDGRQLFAARVLGTSLHTRSMPLLRYEIGDVVEVDDSSQPCTCGRSMPRLHRIHGRCEDTITTPDGRVVTAAFLVFDEIDGIVLGQLLQEMPDRLVVRIVPGREYTRDREIELIALLRRFVGQSMRIDVEYVSIDALRASSPGKWRAVRSLVRTPLATAAAAEAVNA